MLRSGKDWLKEQGSEEEEVGDLTSLAHKDTRWVRVSSSTVSGEVVKGYDVII